MEETQRSKAAHQFSRAADSLVDACQQLEQCGMDDEPIDQLLRSLDTVTHKVHQMHPPDERVKFETADLATPMACHIAAQDANARAQVGGDGGLPRR